MPRPTILDLAREAQVSSSTIDRILGGRSGVKRATVERVFEAAERLQYHGLPTIRTRLQDTAPDRRFGFLLNSESRWLYRKLASHARDAIAALHDVTGQAVIRHLEYPEPDATAAALYDLSQSCSIVAGHFIDHPIVNNAISDLASKGIPVLSLIADVSTPLRYGCIGVNDWQLGRTAGWFMARLSKPGGVIAVMSGSNFYQGQQIEEVSFRGYLIGQSRGDRLVTVCSEENNEIARELTLDLLNEHGKDLNGIFVVGGGLEGAVSALEEKKRQDVIVVGNELTDRTRAALIRETANVILAHPVFEMMDAAIQVMLEWSGDGMPTAAINQSLPFKILISENC